jgi:hypothetical protein
MESRVSTGYDFVQRELHLQLRFERDLLSWRMDFNWSPFGTNANWGFFIGIKSVFLVISNGTNEVRSTNSFKK